MSEYDSSNTETLSVLSDFAQSQATARDSLFESGIPPPPDRSGSRQIAGITLY
jgi:hypothetical protein